jgi:hypothetical protein
MKDPALRSVSLAARGLWVDMLCLMFEASKRGYLILNEKPVSVEQLARMVGGNTDEVFGLVDELLQSGVASRNGIDVIYSRRMVRDEELSQKRAKAGKKGGNPKLLKNKEVTRDAEILLKQNASKTQAKRKQTGKQNLTPSSSTSSSTSVEVNNNRENGPEDLLKQNASKTAYQPPGVPQVNPQYAESFCNRWNEFAKHKCREAELFGISMEIGNVMQRLGLTQFGLDESLENYRQAVTAENSQAKQWSVGRWLREGIDNYRPGYFAMDNYVWDQQNNKNNKTETAAQRRARLEKERNAG